MLKKFNEMPSGSARNVPLLIDEFKGKTKSPPINGGISRPRTIKGVLLASVSALALTAGCSGPFTPDGGMTIGITVGADGTPSITASGSLKIGDTSKQETQGVEDEETKEGREIPTLIQRSSRPTTWATFLTKIRYATNP